MKPAHAIIDNAIANESPLWRAFQKWPGNRPAEYVFLEKSHKGIPDIEILDKLPDYNIFKLEKTMSFRRIFLNQALCLQ